MRRAAGTPLRVASKSVRVRSLLTEVLTYDGWHGVMAFTLPEALWLVRTGVSRDVLVAYPTVDRNALAALCSDAALAAAVTLMVDDVAQLDLVDSVDARRPDARPCGSASISMRRGRCPVAGGGWASDGPPSRPRRHWPRWPASSSSGPASRWSG